ncbi:NADH dehydrogenase [ubiquinone] 1 beta subcomplex subunit 11, mitochondrial [Diabrotica virgifera virgifera]|uniref:NADH dehydrogenase [ubiquinone] 1 beta subcomplex subunit 11, mitochondrial n=1 Tax=Diabrotica virgifera virgifera TaxID=50390 RepID=A0A6P7F0Y2_DIAVI|nr:NADH dehydrogenase [ubiquinone] 1 beta subcomplex subunit 11, mitochondrial [Diabrotica virgifera virgifera]
MSGIMSSRIPMIRRVIPIVARRFVSTSQKKNVTAEAVDAAKSKAKVADQNWISYGYEYTSKTDDRNAMHSIMFVSITLCIVMGTLFFAYMPDYNLRDWAQREAFLELRRREEQGLPPIDANFVDPSKITLPSDEELEGVEIII